MQNTILIVEDEQGLRTLLTDVCEGEGYRVRTASDGEGALRHVRDARPDLVLSIVQMPKLDGLAMARALRADTITGK
jgi:DNA-binding response OmpR family regulator